MSISRGHLALSRSWLRVAANLDELMDGVVNSAVLVLNENYEPLNVCNARRAVVLVDRGKAEVL